MERGYAGSSIEQVAAKAGAGKQTIYRRYPSKRSLFTAVLEDLAGGLTTRASLSQAPCTDPLAVLRETCRAVLEANTNPETVAIYRVLIAESQRFPKLVEDTANHISEPVTGLIRRLIRAARKRGQIRGKVAVEQSARALTGLISGWALRQGLLGRRSLSTDAERNAFFESAWTIFLKGMSE